MILYIFSFLSISSCPVTYVLFLLSYQRSVIPERVLHSVSADPAWSKSDESINHRSYSSMWLLLMISNTKELFTVCVGVLSGIMRKHSDFCKRATLAC